MIICGVISFIILLCLCFDAVEPTFYGLKCNTISKKCSITFNDARYIITNLKKTKFINDAKEYKKNIDDFKKISKIHNSSTTLNNNSIKQTSITNFFHVIK